MRSYPSTRDRVLRARELGIRAYASGKPWMLATNPYAAKCSGTQLRSAWNSGYIEAKYGNGDLSWFAPKSFKRIDLSAEFGSLFSELDATLPDAWPQDGAA